MDLPEADGILAWSQIAFVAVESSGRREESIGSGDGAARLMRDSIAGAEGRDAPFYPYLFHRWAELW